MSAGTNFLDSQRRGFPVQRGCAATARPRFPVPNPTQGTGDPVAGRGGCAEADGRSPAGGDRPAEGPEGSTIDQAQRHGAGHLANGVKASRRQAASWQGPAPVNIEDQVLRVTAPAGSRFKGYVHYLVQELV